MPGSVGKCIRKDFCKLDWVASRAILGEQLSAPVKRLFAHCVSQNCAVLTSLEDYTADSDSGNWARSAQRCRICYRDDTHTWQLHRHPQWSG